MEVQGKLLHYMFLLLTLRPDVAGYSVLNRTDIYTNEYGIPTQDHREMTNANVSSEGIYPQMPYDFKATTSVYQISKIFNLSSILRNRQQRQQQNLTIVEDFQTKPKISFRLFIPDSYIVYINFGLSVMIMTVNVIVIWLFLQKKNRSPLTILLSSLAISDTISAVIQSVFDFIGYTFFSYQIRNNIWSFYCPQGTFMHYFAFANEYLHLASVNITAVISAQKAIAVLFPFWSKSHINNKLCVVLSAIIFGFVLCMYFSRCAILAQQMEVVLNTIELENDDITFFLIYRCISYVVSVTAILVSTGFLCCQLTCLRKNLLFNDFRAAQNRNRRSAFIVILISVIFLLSEGIEIYLLSVDFLLHFVYFYQYKLITDELDFAATSLHFHNLSWMIGYSLNFFVYLLMGKKLRSTLGRGCSKMFNIFRCCH